MTRAMIALLGALLILLRPAVADAFPSDDEIRALLEARVEALGGTDGGVCIVVGVITPQGQRTISVGRLDKDDPRPLDGGTVFEIASVTKAFTALLLAQMAEAGEVALDDPVTKHLPPGTKIPERGRPITLLDLATHTSGLPFMPGVPDERAAPEAMRRQLLQFLATHQLKHDVGRNWDYSNLGYWLLGEALSWRARSEITALVETRVVAPMGMTSTRFTRSPEMTPRLAVGHDAALQKAPPFAELPVYSAMPVAGGLFSSVDDLAKLVSVALGAPSPLARPLETTVRTRRPGSAPGVEQALGWTVFADGGELVFRDGGGFGYASCIVWDPARKIGVVALSNQATSVADIARYLLRPGFPLAKVAVIEPQVEIALAPAVLDRYVGEYEAEGEGVFVIAREDTRLSIQAPADWGLPKLALRAKSEAEFFVSELPLRVVFEIEAGAGVKGMTVFPPRGQKGVFAQRIGRQ